MKAVGPSLADVAVVGGGLAGLAAGAVLAETGFRVTLFEHKPHVGGRASSYWHAGVSETVDNCQHALLGCCTNLIDLYRRIGAAGLIRWYDRLIFMEPGGRCSILGPSLLPAPLHAFPSFLRASCLSWNDKIAIAGALRSLLLWTPRKDDESRSFSAWLREHSQTPGAMERFWKVVVVGALNEESENVSLPSAAMVFRESFLKSPTGGRLGLSRVPLSELHSRAADHIVAHGGTVELRAPVEALELVSQASAPGVRLVVNGSRRSFDSVILAVPGRALGPLLPRTVEADRLRENLCRLKTSPITSVHLWFDRTVTELDHAILLDRTIQWMFHKSRILDPSLVRPSAPTTESAGDGKPGSEGSYLELVISASQALVNASRQEVVDLAMRELVEFFPEVRNSRLVKAMVVKELHATYVPSPDSAQYRPEAASPWPGVFLAGDWTATGWPAIMESAVRSGFLAAEALCRAAGRQDRFLCPGLPPSGLMRLLPSSRL